MPRPAKLSHVLLDFFFLHSGPIQIINICRNACGNITGAARHFIPDTERSKVIKASRLFVFIFAAVILACICTRSILPAMFLVLPRFYGGFMAQLFNVTQHAGLAEDVHDHRLSTRTFYTNPVFQWLYSNMNFHIEHHIFPMVPYHQLPKLHAAIRSQCPVPYTSVWAAWREILPTLWRQASDVQHQVNRAIPVTQV